MISILRLELIEAVVMVDGSGDGHDPSSIQCRHTMVFVKGQPRISAFLDQREAKEMKSSQRKDRGTPSTSILVKPELGPFHMLRNDILRKNLPTSSKLCLCI